MILNPSLFLNHSMTLNTNKKCSLCPSFQELPRSQCNEVYTIFSGYHLHFPTSQSSDGDWCTARVLALWKFLIPETEYWALQTHSTLSAIHSPWNQFGTGDLPASCKVHKPDSHSQKAEFSSASGEYRSPSSECLALISIEEDHLSSRVDRDVAWEQLLPLGLMW